MKSPKVLIVDGLEVACRATRYVEWIPGWFRIYPECRFARLSCSLDYRWGTGRWPVHDEDGWDAWESWWDGLTDEQKFSGHSHAWAQ
jgi:hypothetical protein